MTEPAKHAGGRPSDYDPAFCEQVIEFGREGKSKAYIAAQLGVTRQTLENWMDRHPEFLDAMAYAMTLSQVWWEDKGQSSLALAGFQASMWSRSMAARFPDDWREASRTEHTGKDGGPIESKGTLDVAGLSDEQLRALSSIPVQPG